MLFQTFAALALQIQAPASSTRPADVIGLGSQSCGNWSAATRADGWNKIAFHAWVGGFFTGMNVGGINSYGNLNEGTDFIGLVTWIDNYCATHPLETVSSAALDLAAEMLSRKTLRRGQR